MSKSAHNNMSEKELLNNLTELRGRLMQLSFDLANKKLKDTSEISKTKKEIAQILTALRNVEK